MVRTGLTLILLLLVVIGALFAFRIIDIRQTREAELPKVEGGRLPAFDVDTPEVDVGTRNETVRVPDISITEKADRSENSSER